MVKTKACKSKKVTSAQRHKVDRKKREAKRDMKKAAKSLHKAGMGPKRSKKSREAAKLALKVSNADPDKEMVLTNLLLVREQARVIRADRRLQKREEMSALEAKKAELGSDYDEEDIRETISDEKKRKGREAAASDRSVLYIPTNKGWDMLYQFHKTVDDLVFPIDEDSPPGEGTSHGLPCSAFLITADARCSVQSMPWTLIDRIVERAEEYGAANPSLSSSDRANNILIVLALTKVDCLSAKGIGTQISLLDNALYRRYYQKYESEDPGSQTSKKSKKNGEENTKPVKRSIPNITFTMCPVSIYFDNSIKHLLKILNYHNNKTFGSIEDKKAVSEATNLLNKTACFLMGLPNTGKRSLSRALQTIGSESTVTMIPLRAAKIMQVSKNGKAVSEDADEEEEEDSIIKFALPGAKQLTIVTFPEDESLRKLANSNVVGGDILFQSPSFIERTQEPEACAIMIVNSVVDKVALAQAFCQPAFCTGDGTDELKGCEIFLKGIGHTVRRDKGFNVSPMLINNACTAGQISSSSLLASSGFTSQKTTLLSSTFSNARSGKFVRIGSVMNKGKKGSTGGGFGVKRADGHNALRIGARTFIREFCQSKNVPWAVLRPGPSDDPITADDASYIRALSIEAFNASLKKEKDQDGNVPSFATFAEAMSTVLKPYLVLLPSAVLEMSASAIAPILHDVEGEFTGVGNGNSGDDDDNDDDEGDEEEEEGDDDEEDKEDDDEDEMLASDEDFDDKNESDR